MLTLWSKHMKNGVSRNWPGRLRSPLCKDDEEIYKSPHSTGSPPRFVYIGNVWFCR